MAEEDGGLDRAIRKIFEEKRRKLGIKEVKLDLKLTTVGGPPIVGENVYGEAFPFERPPGVWLEVFPLDATMKEIMEGICHELAHIKYPELSEEELVQKTYSGKSQVRGMNC